MSRKASFPPVASPATRVLVLGSLPGEASLAAGRYYAHPLNQFWRLIGGAIGRDIAALDYDARLAALLAAGVGLWDTIGSARRSGSLDGAIRDAEANPLAALIAGLPNLRCVAFNGATSARIGRRALAELDRVALVQLPSSSPAYCSVTFAQKQAEWLKLRDFLAENPPT